MDNKELREFICEIGRRAYNRGMGAANDGNISVLLDDGTLLCTPTGVSKGFMTPDMICRIDRSGELVEAGAYRPSTEMKMHLCVYDRREDVKAVVHAHPLYATVHAICGKPLTQQIMPESTMFLGEVPLTPYGLPSTTELCDAIIPALDKHDAILLENHGALSYGHDLQSAYFKMEALDYYAKVVYLAAAYGGANEFNADQVEKLLNVRREKFNQPGRHPFID
ncbi:class II aldolase/adducin family protein [Salipiger marinus]|jgi:L-fuculose-phosphate aldolase|uniref:L-fuculose-phosphate aldolase n=1 Tax=Salipiger marinus TaxID=555512 RepID=A0A1G8KZ49_9RHOB|nr:class II aldolase/adducin family protein [Salipiger marinus]SDI48704.1 L-fuculose-phosphate aldolase [Salipiger marinus]|tara:strand:- start:271 stop:939 length:669 start_codon:yes stop_codon:yes gene_type:complete